MIKVNMIYVERVGRNMLSFWSFKYHKLYLFDKLRASNRQVKYLFDDQLVNGENQIKNLSKPISKYKLDMLKHND